MPLLFFILFGFPILVIIIIFDTVYQKAICTKSAVFGLVTTEVRSDALFMCVEDWWCEPDYMEVKTV